MAMHALNYALTHILTQNVAMQTALNYALKIFALTHISTQRKCGHANCVKLCVASKNCVKSSSKYFETFALHFCVDCNFSIILASFDEIILPREFSVPGNPMVISVFENFSRSALGALR